jgi:hypothetical protein
MMHPYPIDIGLWEELRIADTDAAVYAIRSAPIALLLGPVGVALRLRRQPARSHTSPSIAAR